MNTSAPDNVYYDISIYNRESTGTTSQLLTFSETRDTPIISDTSLYELSIVRFQLDTYSLPTYIAEIESFNTGNTDPDKMIESLSLSYIQSDGTVIHEMDAVNLKWVPSNLHVSKPPSLSVTNRYADQKNEYYWGNSFRSYCDLINTALSEATETMRTETPLCLQI